MPDETPNEDRFQKLERLFAEAVELKAGARAELMARMRADDPDLAEELEKLVEASDITEPFPSLLAATTASDGDDAGTVIGPYEVLEPIGSGGFGDVYLARQTKPIERDVALKLVRRSARTAEVIERFERERVALALMDHPGIARVYDAGVADDGRPFFVMEYVAGEAVDRYCDRMSLDVRAKVELLIRIGRALHHAHQKGVIHRDIKPSNVLVSEVDGRAEPKIIDFGIATAIEPGAVFREGVTAEGSIIGTPEYMSPEQARGDHIDTRSDLYALGVLAYRLLTGSTPLDSETIRGRALHEMIRAIEVVEPPKPSEKARTTVAARAPTGDPARTSTQLRGDLDWILLRALEKEPDRRYASVAAFADDLERHLRREPVEAGPISAAYRFRKFAARNKVGVGAAALLLVAITAGLVGTTTGFVRAERALGVAETERQRAEDALAEAQRQTLVTETINDFYRIDVLGVADPSIAQDKDTTIIAALRRAADAIDDRFGEDPEIEGKIRLSIGTILMDIGEWEDGEAQLNRASDLLSGTDAESAAAVALAKLGRVYTEQSRYAEGYELLDRAYPILVRTLGEGSNEAIEVLNDRILTLTDLSRLDDARALADTLIARIDAGEDMPAVHKVRAFGHMGWFGYLTGDNEDAAEWYQKSLDLSIEANGESHPNTIAVLSTFALVKGRLGDDEGSLDLNRRAIAGYIDVLGENHPYTMTAKNNYAIQLSMMGRVEEADEIFSALLEYRLENLGEMHRDTIASMATTARNMAFMERFEEAEPLALRAYELTLEHLGPDDVFVQQTGFVLMVLYQEWGKPDESEVWRKRTQPES
ncbi:MAG: serine/threonine-protein kinase [Planctomycetota bacterium]